MKNYAYVLICLLIFLNSVVIAKNGNNGDLTQNKGTNVSMDEYKDEYEDDNTSDQTFTRIIIEDPEKHSLHNTEDIDWVRMYISSRHSYKLIYSDFINDCIILEIFDNEFKLKIKEILKEEILTKIYEYPINFDKSFTKDEFYYAKISSNYTSCSNPLSYSIQLNITDAGGDGLLHGKICDAITNHPILDATVETSNGISTTLIDKEGAFFIFDDPVDEELSVSVTSNCYINSVFKAYIRQIESDSQPYDIKLYRVFDYNRKLDINDIIMMLQMISGKDINICNELNCNKISLSDVLNLMKLLIQINND